MTTKPYSIFVVDDDPAVRDAVSVVLSQAGYFVSSFPDGASLLEALGSHSTDCLLIDVHMPERSGLDIMRELRQRSFEAPILVMSGQGNIPMAVEAIKGGATDFLEKPLSADVLLTRLSELIAACKAREDSRSRSGAWSFPGHNLLTQRELSHVVAGASNKEAGGLLGISPRTVEVHRARILDKLNARNTADLVRIVMQH
jgi:two-component system response regulator FixJ